ncbi:MAG: cupin domain-containing protein [Silanimonas sp.]
MSPDYTPDDLLAAAQAGLVPDLPMSSDVAGRLRATLLARLPSPAMRVTRASEGEWLAVLPGVFIKRLRDDARDGTETNLWRLDPGAALPPHGHHLDEECLVIEGSVVQRGIEYQAGDYLLAPVGLSHDAFESPRGALLLIRGERFSRPSPALHD